MKTNSLTSLFILLGASSAYARNPKHVAINKRQQVPTSRPASAGAPAPTGVTVVPAATGTAIPPIESITFGMPTKATLPVTATFAAGASVPVSGAPPLPTACKSNYTIEHYSILTLLSSCLQPS